MERLLQEPRSPVGNLEEISVTNYSPKRLTRQATLFLFIQGTFTEAGIIDGTGNRGERKW